MRRIIAMLLALFLLAPAARAESYAFRFDGGAAVVDEDGDVIIASATYESVYALYAEDGSISGYAAGIDSDGALRYAVLSPEGVQLTDFLYESIEAAGGAFVCGAGGTYRIVSQAGVEGADEYSAISYAGAGTFLTLSGNVNDEIADSLTLLAENGIVWQLDIYVLYGLGAFSDDLMPLCDGGSVLFGYIGRDGTWNIPAGYEYAGDFEGGYAVVSTRAGYGVIDASGAAVVEADCDFIDRDGGRILALKDGAIALYQIGADGLVKNFERDAGGASPRLSGSSVLLYGGDAVTVLGADGAARFTAPPTASVNEAGGLYVVRDGDWAESGAYLADADGIPVSATYNTVRLLEGEGASALFAYGIMAEDSYDMKFGMIRGNGEIVTAPLYDELARVGPGLFCAQAEEGAELIDETGSLVSRIK